jgi:hypothetical protein
MQILPGTLSPHQTGTRRQEGIEVDFGFYLRELAGKPHGPTH